MKKNILKTGLMDVALRKRTRFSRKTRLNLLAKFGYYPTSTINTNIAINKKGNWKYIDNRNPIIGKEMRKKRYKR